MHSDTHKTGGHSEFGEGSISSYVIGFLCSLVCTVIAFGLVYSHISTGHEALSHEALLLAIVALALLQLMAQLIFFLHLGKGSSADWNVAAFAFAVLVVFIVVGGSLWIMSNLQHGSNSMEEMYIDGVISPETQAN